MPENNAPVRTPEGARWDCRACGACCRLFELGPVAPHIVQGLIDRDIAARWAPAAQGPWYVKRQDPAGNEAFFFTHRNGACVFLREDNLCAVHDAFGAEAKPAFCREYPYYLVEDPRGQVLVVREDCSGFHDSHTDGPLLTDQIDDALSIPQSGPRQRFAPERVRVLPGVDVSGTQWMDWEPQILALIAENPDQPAAVIARLRSWIATELDVTQPPPDPRRGQMALLAATEALRMAMQQITRHEPPQDLAKHRYLFACEMADHVIAARRHMEFSPPPSWDEDACAYFSLVLRSSLLSKRFRTLGGLPASLGRWILDASLVGSSVATPDRQALTVEQVGPVMARWKRFSVNPVVQQILGMARPALVDLYRHAM